jgi:GMP synthase-like glutamine amidotransferase
MRLHVVLHVDFEGPGLIAEWAEEAGHSLTSTLALTEVYPPLDSFDWLVVMGGPMAADDEVENPWLPAEKRFVASAIDAGKLVLGVCLGAQLVAEVVGGRVRRAEEPEIGWFPVRITSAGAASRVLAVLPDEFTPMSWHADTFDLPLGIETGASSEACENQAVEFEDRVWGLQFHLEWDALALAEIVERCEDDLEGGIYVQSAEEILDHPGLLAACHDVLFQLLDAMEEVGPA